MHTLKLLFPISDVVIWKLGKFITWNSKSIYVFKWFIEVCFNSKRQMVRKVKKHHMRQMEQDIEREKKNIFYCMNPAVTVVS